MSRCILSVILVAVAAIVAGCRRDEAPAKTDTAPAESVATRDAPIEAAPQVAAVEDHPGAVASTDQPRALSETEKIEALIAALAVLKDATFFRNGEEHNVTEAIEHMRRKWNWKSAEIKTVEDFIRIAATGSSISGKPYMIRFADGTEVKSATWFRERLREISSP